MTLPTARARFVYDYALHKFTFIIIIIIIAAERRRLIDRYLCLR